MSFDLEKAKEIASPALKAVADDLKAQFMQSLGEIKDAVHRDKIESIFKEAAEVKLKAFVAKDQDEQRRLARVYELKVLSIETYVLASKIVADAKAASLVKEMLKSILDALGSVALAVLKTVVEGVVSGAITSITGGAGGDVGALLQPGN
jgi:hypothetical protein